MAAGAVILATASGDPLKRPGFTVDVRKPMDVTVHGNYSKGFYVSLKEAGIELGPYRDPQQAMTVADRYSGVLERAN